MKDNKYVILIAHFAPVLAAMATVLAALNQSNIGQSLPHEAALNAPLVAFFVAVMILLNSTNLGGRSWMKFRRWCIGLGSMMSALLWMAHGLGVHPLDPQLWFGFGIFGATTIAGSAFLVLFFVAISNDD